MPLARYCAKYAHYLKCFAGDIRDAFSARYRIIPLTADFYISIGDACRPATHLVRNNLRLCSCPLDWMMQYSLRSAADLYRTGFRTFFADCADHPDRADHHRFVVDAATGMISIHGFSLVEDWDTAIANFHAVMARRHRRMHRYMRKARHIVFVSNRNEPDENFAEFLAAVREAYPARLTCLNIRHAEARTSRIVEFAPELTLYEYSFHDKHYLGDDPTINGAH